MSGGLATRIDALLPQTQCTRCGYPACLPYARAIARGEADIDQCPPGGQSGVDALAVLLGRASKTLNPAFGVEAPPAIAVIDEALCIGCTKCIQACPVDAIVGAAKRMHSILATECTGCELCIPPCPVDCIAMARTAVEPLQRVDILDRADHARRRFDARNRRLDRDRCARDAKRASAQTGAKANTPPISKTAVLEAIARGKARRKAGGDGPSRS